VWITRKLGLHPLMKIQEHYNITLVHQFLPLLCLGMERRSP
jgi:hypothetical protein